MRRGGAKFEASRRVAGAQPGQGGSALRWQAPLRQGHAAGGQDQRPALLRSARRGWSRGLLTTGDAHGALSPRELRGKCRPSRPQPLPPVLLSSVSSRAQPLRAGPPQALPVDALAGGKMRHPRGPACSPAPGPPPHGGLAHCAVCLGSAAFVQHRQRGLLLPLRP